LARQAAARRVFPAAWSARLWARPRWEAASVRRDATEAPSSCFRQVTGRRLVALSEPALWQALAWWRVPAAAWRQPAGAAARVMASTSGLKAAAGVAESVRPALLAPQARRPVAEAAAASGAKVQPPGVAAVGSAPSARRPVAAEVALDAEEAQPPEAAGAALDAVAEPQRVAGERDAVAAQLPAVAAEGLSDGSVQQPEAGHPSAPPSWRPEDHPHPWLAR
jgi:hypothetical protein